MVEEDERMLIVVGALVLTWLIVFLSVIGLLIAESRRYTEERERIADGEPPLNGA